MTRDQLNKLLDEFKVGGNEQIALNIGFDADNISVSNAPANKQNYITGWQGHSLAEAKK